MSQKVQILIVDDNQINRQYFSMSLKKTFANIDVAIDGSDAINQAKKKKYDLILMDIHMPDMNGYDTTQKVRKLTNHKNTIIIATSADSINNAQQCLFDDFIAKPIRPKDLVTIIHKHIHNNTTKNQIFNRDRALKYAYNDNEIMQKLIGMFVNELPLQLKLLKNKIHEKDYTQCIEILHKLKGSCQTCGAENLDLECNKLSCDLKSVENNVAINIINIEEAAHDFILEMNL